MGWVDAIIALGIVAIVVVLVEYVLPSSSVIRWLAPVAYVAILVGIYTLRRRFSRRLMDDRY